jgi:hypothetical protein
LFLAGAFWIRSLRKAAVVIGLLFHLVMVSTLAPEVAAQLAIFAVACIAIYPLYFLQKQQHGPAPIHERLDRDDVVEIG